MCYIINMAENDFTPEYQIALNVEACVYKDCPYFPCHTLDENNLSCIFCYCPYYNTSIPEGGCTSAYGKGKWHYYTKDNKKYKVWDCSDCTYPHEKENAKSIFKSFYIKKLS